MRNESEGEEERMKETRIGTETETRVRDKDRQKEKDRDSMDRAMHGQTGGEQRVSKRPRAATRAASTVAHRGGAGCQWE